MLHFNCYNISAESAERTSFYYKERINRIAVRYVALFKIQESITKNILPFALSLFTTLFCFNQSSDDPVHHKAFRKKYYFFQDLTFHLAMSETPI